MRYGKNCEYPVSYIWLDDDLMPPFRQHRRKVNLPVAPATTHSAAGIGWTVENLGETPGRREERFRGVAMV